MTGNKTITPIETSLMEDSLGVRKPSARVEGVNVVIDKAEQELLRSNELTMEDSRFDDFYGSERDKLIRPTFDPVMLAYLCQQNNTLEQCVSAMEVNVDGTGWEIVRVDGDEVNEEDPEYIAALEFFNEPYPDASFTTQRRQHRRDLETTGGSYWEVIRNLGGEIVFLNVLDAKLTRLVRLDNAVQVNRTITRGGKDQQVTLWLRERRFAQIVGAQKICFFREFGSSRRLNRLNGKWEEEGQEPIPNEELATEIIHFTVNPDITTRYGVPRWINQVPSVLGSRKAEEMNLEFFNSGGLPPAMIFIQGGELGTKARNALTSYLAGKAEHKQRAIVAEVFSTSGDLGSAGNVKVTVERFGSERQNDSMFEKYDARCAIRVRGAWRLPPIFLGLNEDYNFATASVSYMVAEAQVFQPERNEFDEVFNLKVLSEIAPNYEIRSLPISVKDVEQQLKALELSKDVTETETWVDVINEVAKLTLVVDEGADEEEQFEALVGRVGAAVGGAVKPNLVTVDDEGQVTKMDGAGITELADDWAAHLSGDKVFTEHQVGIMKEVVKAFDPEMRKLFKSYVAGRMVGFGAHDVEGVGELLDCAEECMHGKPEE